MLGFTSPNDFKAYFFKNFVWAKVYAQRGNEEVRVMFSERSWDHVFWRDGECFDLERAERMPWILEALQRPEEIREGYSGDRDVYLLSKKKWGQDFCVIVRKPNHKGASCFVMAYPPDLGTLIKIRVCHPLISK
jgi:hypothetical protein